PLLTRAVSSHISPSQEVYLVGMTTAAPPSMMDRLGGPRYGKECQKLNRSFTDRFFWPRNTILSSRCRYGRTGDHRLLHAATAVRPRGQIQVSNVGEGGWLHPRCGMLSQWG